jgi:hypothetical protein
MFSILLFDREFGIASLASIINIPKEARCLYSGYDFEEELPADWVGIK